MPPSQRNALEPRMTRTGPVAMIAAAITADESSAYAGNPPRYNQPASWGTVTHSTKQMARARNPARVTSERNRVARTSDPVPFAGHPRRVPRSRHLLRAVGHGPPGRRLVVPGRVPRVRAALVSGDRRGDHRHRPRPGHPGFQGVALARRHLLRLVPV